MNKNCVKVLNGLGSEVLTLRVAENANNFCAKYEDAQNEGYCPNTSRALMKKKPDS